MYYAIRFTWQGLIQGIGSLTLTTRHFTADTPPIHGISVPIFRESYVQAPLR